jgi:hypothetical protein
MRKLALGLITAGALAGATIVPALAQVGVYAGPTGFDFELGVPTYPAPYGYSAWSPYYGYYDYAPGTYYYDVPRWYARPDYYGYYR